MTPSSAIEQRGASAVEYALLVALLATVIVFAVVLFGGGVSTLFENTNASFDSAISP
ncbi:Flp family type IVb pilin [Nocardioides humi]|uniref:Flp family type IVb pilin n=1 Tax=Nocardioides humi TaxID=449461 RepID=UPI001128F6CF|nr:Flp family type IVb pilin [Nocardioides humi]